jgi:D-aminoacyl-tRNA deacylase
VRAVVSRVSAAAVVVDDPDLGETVVGKIDRGLLALVGVTHTDTPEQAGWIAGKIANLRVFPDDADRMNRSVTDVGGGVLVVSQFTLYGDARAGRRPSYVHAAPPEHAEPLVDAVAAGLREHGLPVATGRFGAHMRIHSTGDGPVTILLDTADPRRR